MKWDDLTMSQKSKLMRLYIRNGITSLDQMSSHFNTYANGGPKKTFQEWSQAMKGKYPWLELDSNKAGYDYERYFNENYDDAIARLNEAEARHFADKYKLPNHPTFSNESIYSQGPRYGGTWTKDDKFIPSVINTQQYPKVYDQNRAYTEEEIYDGLKHRFDEGGPKQNKYVAPRFPEEYQVLPVNKEGLPYYTLPDLEVTAERLPQAKATDANIQRYANAVASGQLKLTQIPNTELRNRVRAKPIVDQIMRDRDKTLAPILMGTVGMPAAIIGGISAAPTVAAIMNNPIVDAVLTIHGAATAPRNIKEGVQEIREGEYVRGALDLGLTALDIWGAGKLARKAARIANPAYRAKHAYNTIAPAGYGDVSKRFKEWVKDLWNNPEIDYVNPKWLKEAKTKKSLDVERFGYTGTGSYLEDDIVNAGKIADEARQDAWAIYNGLPQVHNTYIKNADGTYSYNMKKIMEDSKGTWHPAHAPLSTGQKAAMHDFVTGAGGGLTDFRLTQTGEHGNGVMHLEDVWDLHPFSRTGDKISQRFAKELIEKIGSQTRRDAVQNFRKKMFDNGIFGLSNKGIQKATYPIDRLLNRYRMGEFAPKFNIGEYEAVVGLSDKLIYDLSKSKAMSKLSDKMKSFEVGSISGGKPFKMSTDIPFHRTNPHEEMIEGVGDAEKYYQMSLSGEPIPIQGQLKYGFNPLWIKDLHPVIPH